LDVVVDFIRAQDIGRAGNPVGRIVAVACQSSVVEEQRPAAIRQVEPPVERVRRVVTEVDLVNDFIAGDNVLLKKRRRVAERRLGVDLVGA
jgi:hypothetical protein